LGKVFIVKAKGKKDRGIVLLQGSFSTESRSSRLGGRTNFDNQIVWVFDTMVAAENFVDMFDVSNYKDDPSVVEENTRTIEKSFRATGIDSKICNTLEARLLLGHEVVKIN